MFGIRLMKGSKRHQKKCPDKYRDIFQFFHHDLFDDNLLCLSFISRLNFNYIDTG